MPAREKDYDYQEGNLTRLELPPEDDDQVVYISQPAVNKLLPLLTDKTDIWKSTPIFTDMTSIINENDNEIGVEIDLEEISPPIPPDGGWGWIIMIGSFLCMILVDGMCFSYGIFLSELEETFQATKMQMTLAGSLLTGLYFMTGPFVSGLLNRFKARDILIVGTLMSTTAIFGSAFIYNLNLFIVIFGVFGGIGYGLIYLPAATIVTLWFVKKRATVTGIVMAGSGIGVIIYSLVVPKLIDKYTWRGCIILLAGVNLNCLLAALLFRPLTSSDQKCNNEVNKNKITSKSVKKNEISSSDQEKSNLQHVARQYAESIVAAESSSPNLTNSQYFNLKESKDLTGSRNQFPMVSIKRINHSEGDPSNNIQSNQIAPNIKNSQLNIRQNERFPMLSMEAVNCAVDNVLTKQAIVSSTNLTVPDFSSKLIISSGISHKDERLGQQILLQPTGTAAVYVKPDNYGSATYFASAISLKPINDQNFLVDSNIRNAIVKELQKEISKPVHKKDLFLSGSIMHLNEFLSNTDVASYVRNVTLPAEETHMRQPIWSMIKNVLGLELLKSPTFILLTISSIFSMIGYIVPYQFIKDNAQLLGSDQTKSSHLLAYLGALNVFGRVFTGWLSDQQWANVLLINNVSLVSAGIATSLVAVIKVYGGLIAYSCIFGFTIAAFVSVRTILIVEVLGLDKLTNAFGFLLLFQAFAIIASPPGLGSLYDTFQNFNLIFIIGGLALIISGVLCFPLNFISKWEKQRDYLHQSKLNEFINSTDYIGYNDYGDTGHTLSSHNVNAMHQ